MGTLLRTALAFGFTSVLAESSVGNFAPESRPRHARSYFRSQSRRRLHSRFHSLEAKNMHVTGSSVDEATPLGKAKRPASSPLRART
ncbi:MAG: hypothetical protein MZU79_02540 [Anaerotruncus sp.]|nr:hypothetical protein [Anaerotruncus sp.]